MSVSIRKRNISSTQKLRAFSRPELEIDSRSPSPNTGGKEKKLAAIKAGLEKRRDPMNANQEG